MPVGRCQAIRTKPRPESPPLPPYSLRLRRGPATAAQRPARRARKECDPRQAPSLLRRGCEGESTSSSRDFANNDTCEGRRSKQLLMLPRHSTALRATPRLPLEYKGTFHSLL